MSYPKILVWGTGKPEFALLPPLGGLMDENTRTLIGLFDWTTGSAQVVWTISDDYDAEEENAIRAGSRLGNSSGIFYEVVSISYGVANVHTITIPVVSTETLADDIGRLSTNTLWMPEPSNEATPEFTPERYDGGSVAIKLSNGELVQRMDGYRPAITFEWNNLNRTDFEKFIDILNHAMTGRLQVQPHNDIPIYYIMTISSNIKTGLLDGLYLAHTGTLPLVGVKLIRTIPSLSAAAEFYPLII